MALFTFKKLSPKERLVADKRIQAALVPIVEAQRQLREKVVEMEPLLDPAAYEQAHRKLIAEQHSAESLQAVMSMANALKGDARRDAELRAKGICLSFQDKVAEALPALLEAAREVLRELRLEAETHEREFFAEWNLGREATGITTRLAVFDRAVADFEAGLLLYRSHPNQPLNSEAFYNFVEFFRDERDKQPTAEPVVETKSAPDGQTVEFDGPNVDDWDK